MNPLLFYKVPKTVPSISIFTILQASGNCDIQSLIFDVRYHDSESKRLEIFSGFSFNAGNYVLHSSLENPLFVLMSFCASKFEGKGSCFI